jgi:hypothetical protein
MGNAMVDRSMDMYLKLFEILKLKNYDSSNIYISKMT